MKSLGMVLHQIYLLNFVEGEIPNFGRFVTEPKLPADGLGFKAKRHGLDFVAISVLDHQVRCRVYANQLADADHQARFLQNLPSASFRSALSRVHAPSGQAPPPVIGPPGEQNPFSRGIKNYRRTADTQLPQLANAVALNHFCHVCLPPLESSVCIFRAQRTRHTPGTLSPGLCGSLGWPLIA